MKRRLPILGRWLVLPLVVILLGGCSLFYRSPSVVIADVRVVGLGFTSGTAEIILEVDNPNFFHLEVREFQYLLEVEGREDRWSRLAEGRTAESIRLPRRSVERVTLEVPFQYEAVGTALRSWWDTGAMNYRVQGDIVARGPAGRVDLPFRSTGSLTP